jgi:hypothetical protein
MRGLAALRSAVPWVKLKVSSFKLNEFSIRDARFSCASGRLRFRALSIWQNYNLLTTNSGAIFNFEKANHFLPKSLMDAPI